MSAPPKKSEVRVFRERVPVLYVRVMSAIMRNVVDVMILSHFFYISCTPSSLVPKKNLRIGQVPPLGNQIRPGFRPGSPG